MLGHEHAARRGAHRADDNGLGSVTREAQHDDRGNGDHGHGQDEHERAGTALRVIADRGPSPLQPRPQRSSRRAGPTMAPSSRNSLSSSRSGNPATSPTRPLRPARLPSRPLTLALRRLRDWTSLLGCTRTVHRSDRAERPGPAQTSAKVQGRGRDVPRTESRLDPGRRRSDDATTTQNN